MFVELMRRGYDAEKTMFYYRSRNDREVDFILRKGTRIECLIQVCYELGNLKTEKREVDSLIEGAEELRCNNLFIVTDHDERVIEKKDYKVNVVPFSKF